jgi:hypothetical protein
MLPLLSEFSYACALTEEPRTGALDGMGGFPVMRTVLDAELFSFANPAE